jgi:hypothetical protein
MNKLKIVNEYHEKAIQGLRDMIKEYAQQATENTYPFEVTIMAFDKYVDCDVPTPVSIDNIIVTDDRVIICYNDGDCEDSIELFSYDETYDILCELCKRL